MALFYPSVRPAVVPTTLARLMEVYSQSVALLYQRECQRLELDVRQPPIAGYIVSEGLLSIGAVLRQAGHTVAYFEEDYIRDHRDYDATLRDIATRFDVVAIAIQTPVFQRLAGLVKKLRGHRPSITVVVGGPHATYDDTACLRAGADFVIRGEAETALLRLVDQLDGDRAWTEVPGLSWLKAGETNRSASEPVEITSLPTPAYDLIPEGMRASASVSMTTARGCVAACSFCAEGHFFKGLRYLKLDQLVDRVRAYLQVFPFNYVMLYDSTFTYPRERAIEVAECLSAEFPEVFFGCNARADCLDSEVLAALVRARFITLLFGGDSGSDLILRHVNKTLTGPDLAQALRDALCRVGRRIPFTFVSFVIGHGDETLETAHATIEHIDDLFRNTDVFQINTRLMTPYPGTPVYRSPEKYGLRIVDSDFSHYTRYSYPPVVATRELSRFQVWELFFQSYLVCTEELARRAGLEERVAEVLSDVDMRPMDYANTKPSIR